MASASLPLNVVVDFLCVCVCVFFCGSKATAFEFNWTRCLWSR